MAEWATRIVLSYVIAPSTTTDLSDPVSTTRLVETFLMPGIRALNGDLADTASPVHRARRSSTSNGRPLRSSKGRRT